jgi:hypothetical protein
MLVRHFSATTVGGWIRSTPAGATLRPTTMRDAPSDVARRRRRSLPERLQLRDIGRQPLRPGVASTNWCGRGGSRISLWAAAFGCRSGRCSSSSPTIMPSSDALWRVTRLCYGWAVVPLRPGHPDPSTIRRHWTGCSSLRRLPPRTRHERWSTWPRIRRRRSGSRAPRPMPRRMWSTSRRRGSGTTDRVAGPFSSPRRR